MIELSKSAKKTLLEIISRCNISYKSKEERDIHWNSEVYIPILILWMISTTCFSISWLNFNIGHAWYDIVAIITLLSGCVLFICGLICAISIDDFGYQSLRSWARNVYLEKVAKNYYVFRKYLKIKKSKKFENNLKEDYSELKVWFQQRNGSDCFETLIKELQFPNSRQTRRHIESIEEIMLDISDKIKGKRGKLKEYNQNCISFDELENMIIQDNKFFEKNK